VAPGQPYGRVKLGQAGEGPLAHSRNPRRSTERTRAAILTVSTLDWAIAWVAMGVGRLLDKRRENLYNGPRMERRFQGQMVLWA
jgi:hypothetical protein